MAKSKDVITQIKKASRRKFSADEKIRIVLEGLRGEQSISEICRREGIAANIYYKWSKTFLEAGKNGLTRDTLRDATSDEVRQLKQENQQLKTSLAEAILDVQRYKKSLGL
jgi:transposase